MTKFPIVSAPALASVKIIASGTHSHNKITVPDLGVLYGRAGRKSVVLASASIIARSGAITNVTKPDVGGLPGPIVITSTGHGHDSASVNEEVFISGVGGFTAANGRWEIQSILSANTFSLYDSEGVTAVAYTSGGTWSSPEAVIEDSVAPARREETPCHVSSVTVNGNQAWDYGTELATGLLPSVANGISLHNAYDSTAIDVQALDVRGVGVRATYCHLSYVSHCYGGIQSFPDGWYIGNLLVGNRDFHILVTDSSVHTAMNHGYGGQRSIHHKRGDNFSSIGDQVADVIVAGVDIEITAGYGRYIGLSSFHNTTYGVRARRPVDLISPYFQGAQSSDEFPLTVPLYINSPDCTVIGGLFVADIWQDPNGTNHVSSRAQIELAGTTNFSKPDRCVIDTRIAANGAAGQTGLLVTDPTTALMGRIIAGWGFHGAGSLIADIPEAAGNSMGCELLVVGSGSVGSGVNSSPVSLPWNLHYTNGITRLNTDNGERVQLWPPTRDPVAVWRLDEVSGAAVNLLGTGDLTDFNGVTSAAGITRPLARSFARASSQRLSMASSSVVQVAAQKQMAIAAWVRPVSLPTSGLMWIVSKDDLGVNREYGLYINCGATPATTARFVFEIFRTSSGGGSSQITANLFGPPVVNKWYFLLANYTGNTISLSVNHGEPNWLPIATAGIFTGAAPFQVGAMNSTHHWDGQIESVRLYDRCVSAEERRWMYQLGRI